VGDRFREIVYARVIVSDEPVISHDAVSEDDDAAVYDYYARVVSVDDAVISDDVAVISYYGHVVVYDDAVGVVGCLVNDERPMTNAPNVKGN
jgi:hypothetical protein